MQVLLPFGQGAWHILKEAAANAGRRLLDRGRLGQLGLLPRRAADEEQAPRFPKAH